MRLEGLVTCLNFQERQIADHSIALTDLFGVFQRLPAPPERFVVYFDLRRGADDSADVEIRIRKARGTRVVLYETGPQLVLAYAPLIPLPVEIDGVELPAGGVVIEVVINGRVAGSRVVQFGDEPEADQVP